MQLKKIAAVLMIRNHYSLASVSADETSEIQVMSKIVSLIIMVQLVCHRLICKTESGVQRTLFILRNSNNVPLSLVLWKEVLKTGFFIWTCFDISSIRHFCIFNYVFVYLFLIIHLGMMSKMGYGALRSKRNIWVPDFIECDSAKSLLFFLGSRVIK